MPYIEQVGEFRGDIIAYDAEEKDSGAIGIKIEVSLKEASEGHDWLDMSQYNFTAIGRIYVVGRGGKVIKRNAEALMEHAGWDGTFKSIADKTWIPTPVGVTVCCEEYPQGSGEQFYKIEWVNAYDRNISGNTVLDASKGQELDNKFGSQLRGMGRPSAASTKPPSKPAKQPMQLENPDVPF